MKTHWLYPAIGDIESIAAYIAKEDLEAAKKVAASIQKQVAVLEVFPEIGRLSEKGDIRTLALTTYPYVIAYRITAQQPEILRVLHTSQQWPKLKSRHDEH